MISQHFCCLLKSKMKKNVMSPLICAVLAVPFVHTRGTAFFPLTTNWLDLPFILLKVRYCYALGARRKNGIYKVGQFNYHWEICTNYTDFSPASKMTELLERQRVGAQDYHCNLSCLWMGNILGNCFTCWVPVLQSQWNDSKWEKRA